MTKLKKKKKTGTVNPLIERGNTKKQVAQIRKEMETNLFRLMTFKQIESILTPKAYKVFSHWMRGQTCALDENGDALVYPWDFERFVYKPSMEQGADWD